VRIVHVVSRSQRRGAERVALELAHELDELGHENEIIALVRALDRGQDADLPALVRSASLRPMTRALAAWRLGRMLRQRSPDVVLAHGGCPAQVMVLGFPRRRPAVVWQQILGFPNKVYRQPRRALWTTVARSVSGAVALTQDDADELTSIGLTAPLTVIPNFRRTQRFFDIDRTLEALRLREHIGVDASTPLIGFVGYLVPQKRPERALEVLARVRRLGIPAHLVVAGDGPLRTMFTQEVRARGLDKHVTLLGHRDDVERVFGGVDVAILTSEDEGIPGVAIEAAMTGCPFVTFDLGGVREVVIDDVTGVVIACQDTALMAERVARLLHDAETRKDMSLEARHRSAEFAAPARAQAYADFLTHCHAQHIASQRSQRPTDAARSRDSLRVCIFTPSLSGGGAERSMLRIASALADRGHEVDFVTARAKQAPNNRPDSRVRYKTFGRRHTRSAVVDLSRHLRATRPDVLLTAMDEANVIGTVAARLSGTDVPVVVSFHTDLLAAFRNGSGVFDYLRPKIARWTIRRADYTIGVSDGVRNSLRHIAPQCETKMTRIYNPTVDDDLFALAAEPVDRGDDVDLSNAILAVGRLAPEKGFDLLLRAFAVVAQQDPSVHLVILGEGPDRAGLEALARELEVANRVHLPGFVSNPYQYMARCRVFAFSSRWEGLGNVLVEAAALGCAIVSTDCASGPRELLEGSDQATLVEVDDADALAAALLSALQQPRREYVGDWTEHTMMRSGSHYEKLLLDVAGGGRS
jgi:glycosyltransferase involved in cell wall biosynthesis